MFKEGQRVIVVKYVDKSLVGKTGTILRDSRPKMFDMVKLDDRDGVMYFWYNEIELIK